MIGRSARLHYYTLFGASMRLSGLAYRYFLAPKSGEVKVHLGPGRDKYLDGWVNVDANVFSARIDAWADLRNPLPFRAETVDVFYSYHVIEHLPDQLLPFHFREIFRCLKPGGVVRIGGPNGDVAMEKFIQKDNRWFDDWPDSRRSTGGRLANFLLCRGEHLTILTFSYLEELMSDAGLVGIKKCLPATETNFPTLIDRAVLSTELESTPEAPHSIIVEARKGTNSETEENPG